ncbi:MAG TPA: hypothetical protein VMS77_01860 [Conexivisphaerales archaeon]|nr:hypothetical protein [Conexivisphaerales archaeon]
MASYRVTDGGEFEAYDQRGALAKLGDGLVTGGMLGEVPMHRTLEALQVFREVANTERLDRVLPIATSPVREARNGPEFIRRVKAETGFDFRVLSGSEEGLLSYLGGAKSLDLSNSVFFDLGGGSLEIMATRDGKIEKVLSLPLGALRLAQLFSDSDGSYSARGLRAMEKEAMKSLPAKREMGVRNGVTLAGVGGSVRALARYDQELRRYPLAKVHNYVMTRGAIQSMFEGLAERSVKEIARFPAIGGGRAETVVAGAMVIRCLMEKLSMNELHCSTHGLRDGALAIFLEDQSRFYRRPIREAYVVRSAGTQRPAASFSRSGPLVRAMAGARRVSGGQVAALAHALRLATGECSSFDPPTLFYSSVYEDSPLSHSSQLAASISLVKTRKPRTADWLLERYKWIMEPEYRESIRKLTALISMVELLERSALKTSADFADGTMALTVTPAGGGFPERLFDEAAMALQKEFDIVVNARVRKPRREDMAGAGGRPPNRAEVSA